MSDRAGGPQGRRSLPRPAAAQTAAAATAGASPPVSPSSSHHRCRSAPLPTCSASWCSTARAGCPTSPNWSASESRGAEQGLAFAKPLKAASAEALERHDPPLHPTLPLSLPPPNRLDEVGYGVGLRLLEVLCYRERGQRRETRLLDMLKFVHRCGWAAGRAHTHSRRPRVRAGCCRPHSAGPPNPFPTSCRALYPEQHAVEVFVWAAGVRPGAEQHRRGRVHDQRRRPAHHQVGGAPAAPAAPAQLCCAGRRAACTPRAAAGACAGRVLPTRAPPALVPPAPQVCECAQRDGPPQPRRLCGRHRVRRARGRRLPRQVGASGAQAAGVCMHVREARQLHFMLLQLTPRSALRPARCPAAG